MIGQKCLIMYQIIITKRPVITLHAIIITWHVIIIYLLLIIFKEMSNQRMNSIQNKYGFKALIF
jgi:hypothetical protein